MSAGKGYAYKAPVGSYLFRYVLEPTYAKMVHFMPRWLTPNQMTVLGVSMTAIASFIMMRHFYNDTKPSKEELYACSLLNLVYMILDNLDGKQARRLGMSSAYGEYLDHGGDCWTSLLSVWCVFKLAEVQYCDYALMCLVITTALIHLYHLVTGSITLGGDFFSADEGMICFAVIPLLWAFFPGFSHIIVFEPSGDYITRPVELGDICAGLFLFGQVLCLIEMIRCMGSWVLHPWMLQLALSTGLMAYGRENTVVWALTVAILASFGIHYIIIASCAKLQRGHLKVTPIAAAVMTCTSLAWNAFPEHRLYVAGSIVVVHLFQMIYNCNYISKLKAAQPKQK